MVRSFLSAFGEMTQVSLIWMRLSVGSVHLTQIYWARLLLLLSTLYFVHNFFFNLRLALFLPCWLSDCKSSERIMNILGMHLPVYFHPTAIQSICLLWFNPSQQLGNHPERLTTTAHFWSELKCLWRHILCISVGI